MLPSPATRAHRPNEKADELLYYLGLATVSIVALIGFAIGWRQAGVTAIVIPTTILLTMFASDLMGYTINRVSLFALIFSIGILVDGAIVIIENIARYWGMLDDRTSIAAAIDAVAEVGNPTIVSTLTVVAALLPMLFVSGLRGPYMAPIPVDASAAMEACAGTSAPFNFNGLVRHYFRRDRPEMGDVMVTLLPRRERDRASHVIALELREKLKAIPLPKGASLKVVETPPGPPVMATLLAEICGPDAETRRATADRIEKLFKSLPYIVDVDASHGQPRPRLRPVADRSRLDYFGLSERELQDSVGALMGTRTPGCAPRGGGRAPLPITVALRDDGLPGSDGIATT